MAHILAKICVICGKNPDSDRVSLFSFDTPHTDRYKLFMEACFQHHDIIEHVKEPFICSQHFEPKYIWKHGLVSNAKPTLKLERTNFLTEIVTIKQEEEEPDESLVEDNMIEVTNVTEIDVVEQLEDIKPDVEMNDDCEMVENKMEVFDITYADESSEDEKLSCARCVENEKRLKEFKVKYKSEVQLKAMLKIENIRLKKKIQTLETQVEYSKAQYRRRVQLAEIIQNTPRISNFVRALCQIILLTCTSYTLKQKQVVQFLYFKSAAIYNFLIESLKFNLPDTSAIYKWLEFKSIKPGIDNDIFTRIKMRMQQMCLNSSDVVLILDHMPIKPGLMYDGDNDEIDGFLNDGNDVLQDKTLARHVTCFMVRGIRENWQQLLGFVVTNMEKSQDILHEQISSYLKMCKQIHVRVRAIVCDQSSINRRMYKNLGITQDLPYFEHEGEKVFCLFDSQHLLISLRNCLMKYPLKIHQKTGLVNFEIYRLLYQQADEKGSKCTKLTRSHITPNPKEKLNSQFAIELFSESTADEIGALIDLEKVPQYLLDNARTTMYFTRLLSNIFGCLNSRVPSNLVLRRKGETRDFFNDIESAFLTKLNFQVPRKNIKIHCIDGLRQTITGVLHLSDDLFSDNLYNFLCTNRLSQAPVEQMLKNMKSVNPRPTIAEFSNMFARICSVLFVFDSEISLFSDEVQELDWNAVFSCDENTDHAVNSCYTTDQLVYIDNDTVVRNKFKSIDEIPRIKLSDSAVRYMASYSFYQFEKIIQCENCHIDCVKSTKNKDNCSPSEWYIINKDRTSQEYDGLVFETALSLTDDFYDLCFKQVELFDKVFHTQVHCSKIREKIRILMQKQDTLWYDNEDVCLKHKIKLLDIFLIVLIRINCKWISSHLADEIDEIDVF
ncbi:hypothetical protein DMENIID0001_111660 [Sergentomyia squamirostris]